MDKDGSRKRLRSWCIIGVLVVMALATLWHFIYDWLPCGVLSVVSPVNESPWEHAKLYFIPPLIWYTAMYFAVGKRYPNYVFSVALSLIVMPVFMLALYSIYSSFVSETLPLDIANSLVTIAFGMWVAYRLTISKLRLNGTVCYAAAVMIIAALVILYGLMTYFPLRAPLFLDQQTGQYGIPR